jgi:hypothetical protein
MKKSIIKGRRRSKSAELPDVQLADVEALIAATRLNVSVDRKALLGELQLARFFRQNFFPLSNISYRMAPRDARAVIRTIDKLKQKITRCAEHPAALLAWLDGFSGAVKASIARLDRSPSEWIVRNILQPIYEKFFGRRAGRSRRQPGSDDQKLSGPFVRFAVAAGPIIGEEITSGIVANAFRSVRRVRRRHLSK